jgi:ketosteroid isomerase-like protein
VIGGGDDLAIVYNDWTLTGTGPDGASVSDAGRAVEVVRRQPDGTWRSVVDDPRGRS